MKFASLFLISLLGLGTISPKFSNNDRSFIEVSGTAALEISPNEIHINLQLEERFEKGEKITLDVLEQALKNELAKAQIGHSNLFISDVNAVISKSWFGSKTLSVARYNLKIQDIDKIKAVFKIFEKLKIDNAYITAATHSEIETLKKKNRINAMKAAKEKADYMLDAVGEKTGKPIQINEQASQNTFEANANYLFNQQRHESKIALESTKGKERVVQFENIKITTTVNTIFEIQ